MTRLIDEFVVDRDHSLAARADAMVLSRLTRPPPETAAATSAIAPQADPQTRGDALTVVVRVERAAALLNRDVYALPHSVFYTLQLGDAKYRAEKPVLGKATITWAQEHAFVVSREDLETAIRTLRAARDETPANFNPRAVAFHS